MKIKLSGTIENFDRTDIHKLTIQVNGKTPRGAAIGGYLQLRTNPEVTRDIKLGQFITIEVDTDGDMVPSPFDK